MSINNFDLNLLKVFVSVAENGGFTKAAQKLFIEQPSVTRAIQRLEGEVGTLFLRTKRRVQLTTKGSDLLVIAKNVLGASEDFLNIAKNKEAELSGVIKFGAESPISSFLMPDVIQLISIECPRFWPMMHTGITDDVVTRIKNGELEFGLFFYTGNPVVGLEYEDIVHCPFKVIASPHIKEEGLNSFIGSREVNESNSASLPAFSKLKKINKFLRIKYSANDLNAYKELLLRGLGIGLLPEMMVEREIRQRKLRTLHPELQFKFPICLVRRRSYPLSLEGKRIVSLLLEATKGKHSVRKSK